MSQRELADRVGVEGPTLVRVLDKLEGQGLVERRADDGDRRAKQIHLTEAATPVLGEISRISTQLRQELLADIASEEQTRTMQVLKVIADRLEKM